MNKHATWYQDQSFKQARKSTLLTKGEVVRSNVLGFIALAVMIAPFLWAFVEKLSN